MRYMEYELLWDSNLAKSTSGSGYSGVRDWSSIGPHDTKSKTVNLPAAYHDDYDYDYDYDYDFYSGESLPYRNILSHLHKE